MFRGHAVWSEAGSQSGVLVDFDQIYNEAIKPAIEAPAGSCHRSRIRRNGSPAEAKRSRHDLTLGHSEWEFFKRRSRQEGLEFVHLFLRGFFHPRFGSGGKGFLQALLTHRFFL